MMSSVPTRQGHPPPQGRVPETLRGCWTLYGGPIAPMGAGYRSPSTHGCRARIPQHLWVQDVGPTAPVGAGYRVLQHPWVQDMGATAPMGTGCG